MSANVNAGAGRPTVFVSYSHKDEVWKDRLVRHLKVLEPGRDFEVWDDRRIAPGSDWQPDIQKAMDRAVAAVLLISADFLTSGFILGTEVPFLLERRASAGLPVIPLIVWPCAWDQVKWLSPIQCRPKDGRPLSAGTDHEIEDALAALARISTSSWRPRLRWLDPRAIPASTSAASPPPASTS